MDVVDAEPLGRLDIEMAGRANRWKYLGAKHISVYLADT